MSGEDGGKPCTESFCTAVQNPDRMVRQRALKTFEEDFIHGIASDAEYSRIFDETYLHILRCYSDRFESVRTVAVSVMDVLLDKLPSNNYYLDCIVPVLAKRIGQAETIEDSEELRLLLLEQLATLVVKYSDPDGNHGDPLLKVFDSVVDTLIKTLRDPYPAAQKKSCEIVMSLAVATPSLHYRAEVLVAPAKTILAHRHSANRIAAIETLGVLSLHILSNGDRISEIIMALSPLLMDDVPFVRRACGRVGCLMLEKLRDRYSFFHRILPLVLNCLCDETVEVREDIESGWKKAGEQYYQENETELSKVALIEKLPVGYPVERYVRPTIACRAIVQRSLRVVNLVLHEMEEWKENIRLHATKLLKQIVLHAERAFSTLFIEVNPVLAKTCMDAERSIVLEALNVCELMGILLEYDTWNHHVLNTFRKYPTIGQLRCMRTLFASCVQIEAKSNDVRKFAALLLDPDVCHNHEDAAYQQELLEFCSILASIGRKRDKLTAGLEEITITESDDGEHQTLERILYTVALKVVAFCQDVEEKASVRAFGVEVLQQLDREVDRLHQHHLASVLCSIGHLDSENSDANTSIRLLCGIVSVCGFQETYFTVLEETLRKAVKHAAPEGKVKIFSAISVAMLSWNDHNRQQKEEQISMLKTFTESLIAPHLVWSAGRSAESIRTMATACFASMAQGVQLDVYMSLLPNYLNVLAGLVDDNCISTRAYTLKALVRLQALDFESLKLIAFPIMARLDDPSVEVRELAAVCLGRLKLVMDSSDAPSTDQQSVLERWQDILRQILSVMFLHLENPETKLRSAIYDSLKRLYADNRAMITRLADEVPSGCSYKKDLEAITSQINNI
ncbi:dynein axonemal assembly factor 5 [Anopheles moucheti]|uniref:dynein axonemal assembly factor 5 n=1 Tax=Anopheles moucheti TaxID=186751 RepID=UPI0022F03C39|nr:dynein axonemal assembly factor 5 [Anopheles moucheti]